MNDTPLLYVAGPYSANGQHTEQDHINRAEEVSIQLIGQGFHVITPHKNTAGYEKYEDKNITFETWINMDLNILKRCDGIYLMIGWGDSKGATIEAGYSISNCIKIIKESDYPPKKLTLNIFNDIK